jgi:Terminase large subunit, T4likevirus-type, N-terminal
MTSPPRTPAVQLMRNLGLEPDAWQVKVLESISPRLLLNCCRQAGKSTVVALLGLVEALFVPGTRVLLLSRSHRQSTELFRIMLGFYERLGSPYKNRKTAHELSLSNMSRVICLPCREDTIRGYSRISLLIIDEAARVPDDLYRAVRPMLAVSAGRLICLSTPYGKRGFFHDSWASGGDDWGRVEVPASQIPRITPTFLEEERRALGDSWFRQEYCCSFEALEGLVYPDFARCVVPTIPSALQGRRVGGLDFGFRNPFAAVWGTLDHDGVLWLTGEHYARNKPLSDHARLLPREVTWYADPAGAGDRAELCCAGFTVRAGVNKLRPGIAAVTARLQNNGLRIQAGRCPNLLAEAGLYRYEDSREAQAESPLDRHNHALDALRYLIYAVDARRLAGRRPTPSEDPAAKPRPKPKPWLRLDNEAVWTRIF